jgi:hypothetical protein
MKSKYLHPISGFMRYLLLKLQEKIATGTNILLILSHNYKFSLLRSNSIIMLILLQQGLDISRITCFYYHYLRAPLIMDFFFLLLFTQSCIHVSAFERVCNLWIKIMMEESRRVRKSGDRVMKKK